jgi:hypothetical protein
MRVWKDSSDKGGISGSEVYQPSSSPGNRMSGQVYQALRHHAKMFEALGIKVMNDSGEAILLADGSLTFSLEYRLQRKILARIYHLRTKMKVTSPTSSPALRYRLDLQILGLMGRSRNLRATGPGAKEGQKAASRLLSSGIVCALAESVDLENLSIEWASEAGAWEITLEPYPGSHLRTIFPPMTYTVWLQEPEARAIRTFLVRVSDILRE